MESYWTFLLFYWSTKYEFLLQTMILSVHKTIRDSSYNEKKPSFFYFVMQCLVSESNHWNFDQLNMNWIYLSNKLACQVLLLHIMAFKFKFSSSSAEVVVFKVACIKKITKWEEASIYFENCKSLGTRT